MPECESLYGRLKDKSRTACKNARLDRAPSSKHPFRHHGMYNLGAATATTTTGLHRHTITCKTAASIECSVPTDFLVVEDPHQCPEGRTASSSQCRSMWSHRGHWNFKQANGFTQGVLAVPRTFRKPFIFCLSDCIYCTSEPGGSVQRQERESQVTRKGKARKNINLGLIPTEGVYIIISNVHHSVSPHLSQ